MLLVSTIRTPLLRHLWNGSPLLTHSLTLLCRAGYNRVYTTCIFIVLSQRNLHRHGPHCWQFQARKHIFCGSAWCHKDKGSLIRDERWCDESAHSTPSSTYCVLLISAGPVNDVRLLTDQTYTVLSKKMLRFKKVLRQINTLHEHYILLSVHILWLPQHCELVRFLLVGNLSCFAFIALFAF